MCFTVERHYVSDNFHFQREQQNLNAMTKFSTTRNILNSAIIKMHSDLFT